MKVTRLGRTRPSVSIGAITGGAGGAAGTGLTSTGSNSGTEWRQVVYGITANGSNALLGPFVNFAAGSNTLLTLDAGPGGSMPSNTIRIHSTASGGGGSSGITVADEGTPLATAATTLDFVGAGVTASGTGATKTITIPGGSGSLDPGLGALWAGPTITNTEDDHFSGSSLDAKWLSYTNFNGTASFGLVDSWVELTTGAKIQAVPVGDWTIETELLHGDHSTSGYTAVGLILTSGTNASSSSDRRFGIGAENSLLNWRIVLDYFTNNAYASTPATVTSQDAGAHHRWLRIRKSSTTYYFEVSDNRFVWTLVYSTSSLGITPTHFGMFSSQTSGAANGSLFNYFVRY